MVLIASDHVHHWREMTTGLTVGLLLELLTYHSSWLKTLAVNSIWPM